MEKMTNEQKITEVTETLFKKFAPKIFRIRNAQIYQRF